MDVIIEGELKKWGGSLAIRIPADQARRLHLRAGRKVNCRIMADDEQIDLGDIPTVKGGHDASARHDEYIGEALSKKYADR